MNFLNEWIFAALNFIYGWVGNYGVAIILLTIVFKIVIFPTALAQRNSMRKQRAMQPLVDEINKKYQNDPERKNQKTMELYKKEKFNPLSGCLPVLLTMPLFFVLISVMRTLGNEQLVIMFQNVQAGGVFTPERFLWINNVWQPDNFWSPVIPDISVINALRAVNGNSILTAAAVESIKANYQSVMAATMEAFSKLKNGWFILPLLAGGIQLLTTKVNPAMQMQSQPTQPGQQQGMMNTFTKIMPLMYVFFCATGNTVFTLYWVTSSLIELLQQLAFKYMEQRAEKAALPAVK